MGLHWRSACALSGTQSTRWGERAQRSRLRELDRRIDLDEFTKQLCEGLVSGHLVSAAKDTRALTAYLRFIQE